MAPPAAESISTSWFGLPSQTVRDRLLSQRVAGFFRNFMDPPFDALKSVVAQQDDEISGEERRLQASSGESKGDSRLFNGSAEALKHSKRRLINTPPLSNNGKIYNLVSQTPGGVCWRVGTTSLETRGRISEGQAFVLAHGDAK